jgi:outer membrane lipopolysaccharide assembly protein LptE/RlpB
LLLRFVVMNQSGCGFHLEKKVRKLSPMASREAPVSLQRGQ